MDQNIKHEWVCAILMDRMKYVINGEAEIYFSYFVRSFQPFYHIKNEEDVMHFWKKVYNSNPDGGTTSIGSLIESLNNEINQKRLFNLKLDLSKEKPEVLIINDGKQNCLDI